MPTLLKGFQLPLIDLNGKILLGVVMLLFFAKLVFWQTGVFGKCVFSK